MRNRYAFLVDEPGEDNQQEFRCSGDGLTPEEAVQRTYDETPDGTEIVRTLRGTFPEDIDLSPPDQQREVQDDEAKTQSGDDESDMGALHLTDEHWRTAVSAIEDGEADEFLDDLQELESRDSVIDAIRQRREEVDDG